MKKSDKETKEPELVFTPEEQKKIEAWKKQYGGMHYLALEGKRAFLRRPDRKIVAMVRSLGEGEEVATMELLLDACWLEGDEEIKTDDNLFLSVMPELQQILDLKAVTLKKI